MRNAIKAQVSCLHETSQGILERGLQISCTRLLSCPGCMFANSIPARLVATRMRVVWPRARACPCHARVRLDLPCTCARMCHAQ